MGQMRQVIIMKYIYLFLYRATEWLLDVLNTPGNWLDSNFPIQTDKYGTCLGGEIGLRLMRYHGSLHSVCRQLQVIKCPAEEEKAMRKQVIKKTIGTVDMSAKDANPELLKFLILDDESLRGAAMAARGKLEKPGKETVPKFIELLKTGHGEIQLRAIWALWDMGPAAAEAAPELVKLLATHPAPLIDRFREMHNWRAHTSRRTIRFHAAAALAVISPSAPEVLPILIEMTQDWEYRWLGITSLGKIGCYAIPTLPLLQKFLTSRRQTEAKAAREAIAKIGKAENIK